MAQLRFHNSRTRRKEQFAPIDPANLRMYVCGPTVYDRAHLGNARPVVVFDVLFRLLRHVYGADHVTYVRNFTDVDDKINATALARKQAGDPRPLEALIAERTEETIGWYHADMDALGALRPTHEPRATAYIEEMKAMISILIDRKHAYVVRDPSNNPPKDYVLFDRESTPAGHSLFDVEAFENYGKFSGRTLEEMIAGARVEVAPYKRNPADFVLWKPSSNEEPGWEGPKVNEQAIGRGRPGWHIECSAMAQSLLGDSFDIHGGGLDLQFPHHENEIAQSCCALATSDDPLGESKFARVWMHNEMLQVEGRKMSKSLGNFFTVRDLLDRGVPGPVIRYVLMMTHYRKPMDWTGAKVNQARDTLGNFTSILEGVKPTTPDPEIVSAIADDLNTPLAITLLHRLARDKRFGELGASLEFLGLEQLAFFWQADDDRVNLSLITERLNEMKRSAKETKDYSQIDLLKSSLISAGVEVRMSQEDIELLIGSDFDSEKLAVLASLIS